MTGPDGVELLVGEMDEVKELEELSVVVVVVLLDGVGDDGTGVVEFDVTGVVVDELMGLVVGPVVDEVEDDTVVVAFEVVEVTVVFGVDVLVGVEEVIALPPSVR